MEREELLKYFNSCKRPASFNEIASKFLIGRKEKRNLKKVLRDLLKSGELIINQKGMYGLPEEMCLVKGYFEAHRDGYGFVIPEAPGERDIFIPARATIGAMEGDRVIARVENLKKRDGRVLRILERTYTKVVGTIEISRLGSFLRPKNLAVSYDLYIAPKDRGGALDGDLVIAEIITYPTAKRPASGKVIKKLKHPETLADDVELIIDEFNLSRRFPRNVTQEAKRLSSDPGAETTEKRKDLTRLQTFTIDGEKAKDFDDAVSIKLTKHGYRLYVHIADVSHFVPWESSIDLEARKRATSVYFPDRVIPMLPKRLSEDLCSLKPKVPRLAFTVEMDFSRTGKRTKKRFYTSIIKSSERMTYTKVKNILIDEDPGLRKRYSNILGSLELMGELCSLLRANRLKRGSLDFDLPEPEVLLDLRGNPEKIVAAERNFAHMIVEEFMIASNEAVAEYIESKKVPSLYRIHESPDASKLEEILHILHSVSNIKKRHLAAKDLPDIIEKMRGNPSEEIINYLVLRAMMQARYATDNIGHFGLASRCYTHFTSPIRRYPDLVVHRTLKNLLKIDSSRADRDISYIAFSSSKMERIADKAERTVLDTMRAWFMNDHLGEKFRSRVVGISPRGLKVRLKEFYIDGFIHVSNLADDYYIYDEKNLYLTGRRRKKRYSMGDEITVTLERVNLEEREIVFGLSR